MPWPKIATPISHLARNKELFKQIADITDCFEMRPGTLDLTSNEEVYHCDSVQIMHELSYDTINNIAKTINAAPELKFIAFHCATNCDQPILNGRKYMQGGYMYTHKEMIYNGIRNVSRLRELIPSHVQLAVENNNFYVTEWKNPYSIVTDADFLNELVTVTDIKFLFDVSHAKVTCKNLGIHYNDYITRLPMHRLGQIQLCQHSFIDNEYVDSHDKPTSSTVLHAISLALEHGCDYLTIEYYKDYEGLYECTKYMREALNARKNLQYTL